MPVGYLARKLRVFVVDRVLGLHDTPHRIALGVGIGILVTWTPTIGFQMALIFLISALLRANKVVGVPLAWISNPATLWLYVPNYLLGCWMLGERANTAKLMKGLTRAFALTGTLGERIRGLEVALWSVFYPLWVGSLVIGALLGAAAYGLTYYGVNAYRRHRYRKHREHRSLRAAPGEADAAPSADTPR